MTTFRTATPRDWSAIERLLSSAGLPLDGAREHLAHFELADDDGMIVGCAAIEPYATAGLVRSVAIDPSRRGARIGETLVRRLVDRAKRLEMDSLWLLTTTAAAWFPRFGFASAPREDVPEALRASKEFQGACPASATVMRLNLR